MNCGLCDLLLEDGFRCASDLPLHCFELPLHCFELAFKFFCNTSLTAPSISVYRLQGADEDFYYTNRRPFLPSLPPFSLFLPLFDIP